ncbi:MAG: hypothetical protein LWY06_11725 [Firmicutes bacterium]|nr:hypothetical protein [Bacillota bacterium]
MDDSIVKYEAPFYEKPMHETRYFRENANFPNDFTDTEEQDDSYRINIKPVRSFRSITGPAKLYTIISSFYIPAVIVALYAASTDEKHSLAEAFTNPAFLAFLISGFAVAFLTFKSLIKIMGRPMSVVIDGQNLTIDIKSKDTIAIPIDTIEDIKAELTKEQMAVMNMRSGDQTITVSNSLSIFTLEYLYTEIFKAAKRLRGKDK